MPILANARHELFAQAVASGKSASEAYRRSGGKGKNADVQAAKLVVSGSICERVAELKEAQSQKSELSRDRLREFLTEVILTPAGKVDEQSRLCQSCKITPEFREIRMPDKLAAAAQLAKLCGWSGKKTAIFCLLILALTTVGPLTFVAGPAGQMGFS